MSPTVTFLTDFGYEDSYVAEVKAVLLGVPQIQIIDISHSIPPYDIFWGAFQLLRSYSYFPATTVHLAVVDPGVGTARRAIFVDAGKHRFVGPDNGLLTWAVRDWERRSHAPSSIHEIETRDLEAQTFHGRDVFAPFVVSLLMKERIKLRKLSTMEGQSFPPCQRMGDAILGRVIGQDRFGNIITSIPLTEIDAPEGSVVGRVEGLMTAENYASIPEGATSLVRGSHGFWEVSCRELSAWNKLQARRGDQVSLKPLKSSRY